MRQPTEENALDAPAPLSLAPELTGKDGVCAAAKLCNVHLRVQRRVAFLVHRAQDMVGAAVMRAVRIALRDDLRAARFRRVYITKARQIDIALAGDGVARLKHVGRGAIHDGRAAI